MTKGLDHILEGSGDQPGGSVIALANPTGGQNDALLRETTSARVHGDRGDAQSWVVTLGVIEGQLPYDLLDVQGGAPGQRCLLRWGLDAASFFAELDWRPCSFVVHGAFVEVSASSPITAFDPQFRYAASITPAELNAVAGTLPGIPTRTIDASISPGGTTSIVVPQRARAVRFYNRFLATVPNINFQQRTTVGGAIVASVERISTIGGIGTGGTAGALPMSEWVPLLWSCRALTLINPSGVLSTAVAAEFLIDVG